MKITISGVSGAGKSSTAILLAEKLDYTHYSMGDLQRKLAKKHGMTTVEFSKVESKDPKYDKERDNLMKKIGQKEDNFVIDAWLGAKFIPQGINIFLDCDLDIRAKRIFKETQKGKNTQVQHKRESDLDYSSVEEVKESILKKEKINRIRWIKYYDFDFKDRKNYNLVLDTTDLSIKETVDEIILNLKNNKDLT